MNVGWNWKRVWSDRGRDLDLLHNCRIAKIELEMSLYELSGVELEWMGFDERCKNVLGTVI